MVYTDYSLREELGISDRIAAVSQVKKKLFFEILINNFIL